MSRLSGINGGGHAWGDIFTVNTPYIDQLGKRLYDEHKLDKINRARESERLDQEFSKNVANIRDVDVNEYADKYQNWKQAKMGLMRMKPSNHKEYLQAQLESQRRLADLSQFGATSVATKAQLGDVAKPIATDKDGNYIYNAHDIHIRALQTPTSQLKNFTVTDPETGEATPFNPLNLGEYEWQGNKVAWQPKLAKAEGTAIQRGEPISSPIKDKAGNILGTQTVSLKAKNSPLDYYTSLAGGLVGSKAQKSLNATYKFPDDQAQQIVSDYNDRIVNNPTAVRAWGENGVRLPTNALLMPSTRTVALLAMQHALSNLPSEEKPVQTYNRGSIMDKQEQFAIDQQRRGAKFAMDRVYAIAGLKKTTENDEDMKGISAILNNTKNIIDSGKPVKRMFKGQETGQVDPNLVEVSDIDVLNAAKNIKDAPISKVTFDKSKDQFNIEYDGWVDTQNNFHPAETVPLSKQDYLRIKVDKMNPKNKGNTNAILDKILSENNGLYPAIQKAFAPETPKPTHTKTTTTTYDVRGKKMTHDDLKKLGYTDEQINQAIKLGNIK